MGDFEADQKIAQQFLASRNDLRGGEEQWKLIMTHDELQSVVEKLAKDIDSRFVGQNIVICCILKGAAYFLVDLTRRLTIPYSIYYIEASSYFDSQTQGEKVELLSILVPNKFKGRKVVLIDELYDNGATVFNVKKKLTEEPLNIPDEDIFTCTLMQKEKDTATHFPAPDLIGLKVPDVWLVGYGLDDRQEKRGWSHLFGVPKLPEIPKTTDDAIFEDTEKGREAHIKIRNTIRAASKQQ